MKLTKEKLKVIIKEELANLQQEMGDVPESRENEIYQELIKIYSGMSTLSSEQKIEAQRRADALQAEASELLRVRHAAIPGPK